MSHPCPKCEAKAKCVNSRPAPDGTVQRRFNCLSCGCRFSSVEVIVSVDGGLAAPQLSRHPISNSNKLLAAMESMSISARSDEDLIQIMQKALDEISKVRP